MPSSENLEVYKQRYAPYRHLDRLRWQMFQIATPLTAVVLAFGRDKNSDPDWWALLIVGLVLIVLGIVMERIRQGISANGSVLREIGKTVGDENIPKPAMWSKSVSFWISAAMFTAGTGCCLAALSLPLMS